MKKRIASLTSNIINPFLLSLAIILLLSFTSTPRLLDALKWALISIALSILPVFLVIVYLVRNGRLDTIFIKSRGQRNKLYLLAAFCTILSYFVLTYLRAPAILVAAFIAGFSAVIVFMSINLWWKISLHTAFVAASITILIMLYGWTGTLSGTLLPLTAWSRIELKQHSLAQVATGALLAALIVVGVFYPLVLS